MGADIAVDPHYAASPGQLCPCGPSLSVGAACVVQTAWHGGAFPSARSLAVVGPANGFGFHLGFARSLVADLFPLLPVSLPFFKVQSSVYSGLFLLEISRVSPVFPSALTRWKVS
jgi:hypothetical protein